MSVSAALMLTAAAVPASAQDAPRGGPPDAAALARFLDEQTLAVVRFDLDKLDVNAAAQWATDVLARNGGDAGLIASVGEARKTADAALADLKKAGAKRVYMVVSLADAPFRGPVPGFLVVPVPAGREGAAADIQNVLTTGRAADPRASGPGPRQPEDDNWAAEVIARDVVVAGTAATLRRLRDLPPAQRPDVEKVFSAAGQDAARGRAAGPASVAAFTVAVVPTDDMRRVVEEMLPSLPTQIGGGPSTVLTRGATWAVLTLDPPPKGSFRVVFQSKDAASAEALSKLIGGVTKVLAAVPQRRQRDGADALARAAGSIRPAVQGDRVILALGQKDLDTLAPPLAAAVGAARQRAATQVALSNVRQLLQGCMLYANEHKNTFPDTLDQAVRSAGADERAGAALLRNPRRPAPQNGAAASGYEYLKRPQGTFGDTSDKVMIYEKFDKWPPDGIVVGFADGHVELVNDEAQFHKLLDQTRAEAAPRRRRGGENSNL